MNFIKGNNRNHLIFSTLEMQIELDNPVRFVDAFVEHLDLSQLGFVVSDFLIQKNEERIIAEKKLLL